MRTIRFEHVSKRFSSMAQFAVSNCTFTVEAGAIVALVGPSGCGKTTLLKMINRLYEPTEGTIYLDAVDIRQLPATTLRQQIGYVIQQIGLFPHMTVAENIAVVPRLLGWPRARIAARIDELLALFSLPPDLYRDRYPAHLSGGQQQRVGLARALAADPGVILMDEPFSAVDAITRAGLQDELLRLQRTVRKTILLVTHDLDEALRLADRILVMRTGRIVQYDTPSAILARPANRFVADLIGVDRVLRQLGLLPVAGTMVHRPDGHPQGGPTIGPHEDLRRALALLLQTGAPALTVVEEGRAIGTITLEQIRATALLGDRGEVAG